MSTAKKRSVTIISWFEIIIYSLVFEEEKHFFFKSDNLVQFYIAHNGGYILRFILKATMGLNLQIQKYA